MRKILFFFIYTILFYSCQKESVLLNTSVAITFSHTWENTPLTSTDFNMVKYTNANGETLSIEQLRYVVSNVILTNKNNEIYELAKYKLINVGENKVSLSGTEIPIGTYTFSFVFGLTDNDNIDGIYQDLNSVSFNVPGMLGGGYHYLQLDGKYIGQNLVPAPYNYHMIRAADRRSANTPLFKDTSFKVELGVVSITEASEIKVKMDVAEWFQNPNTWDLNVLNTVLMPNFEAQILMNENGKSVFNLGTVD